MAGSSAGRLRRDSVTLTFDFLTPKPNQFVFVLRCTNDKSLAKNHQQIGLLEILQKHNKVSDICMDMHAKHMASGTCFVGSGLVEA